MTPRYFFYLLAILLCCTTGAAAQASFLNVFDNGLGAQFLSVVSNDHSFKGFTADLARSGVIEGGITYLADGSYSSVAVGITGYPVRQGGDRSTVDLGLSVAVGNAGTSGPAGNQATFYSFGMTTFSRLGLGGGVRFVPGMGAGLMICPKGAPSLVAGVTPQASLAIDMGETLTFGFNAGMQLDTEETSRVIGIGLVARFGKPRAIPEGD